MAAKRSVSASNVLLTNSSNAGEEARRKNMMQSVKEELKSMKQQPVISLPTTHPSADLLSPANIMSAKAAIRGEHDENVAPSVARRVAAVKKNQRSEWDGNLEKLGYVCPRVVPSRRKTVGDVVANRNNKNGDGGGRINVFVRVRPLCKQEKEAGAVSCLRIAGGKDIFLSRCLEDGDYLRVKRSTGRYFSFDGVFPESSTQDEVYNASTAELVESVLQGKNGSVFCYGATGAGKTHTMLGTLSQPGVMFQALMHLFSKIEQSDENCEHQVYISYLEIYNENVFDLIVPGRNLHIKETEQGITVVGLSTNAVFSAVEVMTMLQKGNENRTTEPTMQNATSSRSHAILQILIEYKAKEGPGIICRRGKLSLIDLAGSERVQATDDYRSARSHEGANRSARSHEGANINRSLLALSNCIKAVVEGRAHVPFRNSKLTLLLKESLGGACNTVMIANVSPSDQSLKETQTTLYWADQAKEIRTKACTTNIEWQPEEGEEAKLVLQLQRENEHLRQQLVECRHKIATQQKQIKAMAQAGSPEKSAQRRSHRSIKKRTFAYEGSKSPEDILSKMRMEAETDKLSKEIARLKKEYRSAIKNMKSKHRSTVERLQSRNKEVILNMQREHALQLKQKADFIRELCQQTKNTTTEHRSINSIITTDENARSRAMNFKAAATSPSPVKTPERKRFTMPQMCPITKENTGSSTKANNRYPITKANTGSSTKANNRYPITKENTGSSTKANNRYRRAFDEIANDHSPLALLRRIARSPRA